MDFQTSSSSSVGRVRPADRAVRESAATLPERVRIIDTWVNADERASTPSYYSSHRSELASRAVNIVLASVGLALAAPLFISAALAVKLSSPGPIFYRQPRVG